MNKTVLFILSLVCSVSICAQTNVRIKIVHGELKEALPGAVVRLPAINKNAIADSSGIATLQSIPNGKYLMIVSYAGFHEWEDSLLVPSSTEPVLIELEAEEEEEVIVQSTRTSRTIPNTPTRIEVIELEEIDEKSNMRPANVSMLLHESTGILVQQTSATSANASIRIQGLDGRYTQLLKDGFASFGNFASGLSVLEIPPMDLQQVEVIKGPVSTLYGGGAIAGVVNFISKSPKERGENSLLLNYSSIGQANFGFFSAKKFSKTGYTALVQVNKQREFDKDNDDFTEVPRSFDFTVHPRLYIYPDQNNTLIIGNSFTKDSREAGDMTLIKGSGDNFHRYFEDNESLRNTSTLEWKRKLNGSGVLVLKESFSVFDRIIEIPDYLFSGINYNSFTDISWLHNLTKHSIVAGGNFVFDNFNEKEVVVQRNNKNLTGGLYVQDTWDATEKLKLESGIRVDVARHSNELYSKTEFFALPRFSLLIRFNEQLSSRIGGGMGYKLPTLFTEQTETLQYRNIKQLDGLKAERSYGSTADINLRTRLGEELEFSFNQMFFYTWISTPLVLVQDGADSYQFINADDPVISKGFETNARFIYADNFKLFLGYTFTEATANYAPGNAFLSRVPKHKINSALIFEKEGVIKMGLEGYFTGKQYLSNGDQVPAFKELGFMVEKIWKKFSIYINFENFTDTRQSAYKRVANDPHDNPTFDEIWTHTEGFVVNGGVKLRFTP